MTEIIRLLDKVESNEIILPEFQREFVWKKEQAKSLINSLYNGFPIGSLLIWETENPPKIKNDAVDEEKFGLFKVLLDGQQRLTVLYMLMKGDIPPYYEESEIQHDPRKLYFNVEDHSFQYENKSVRESPVWVKVTDVFDDAVSPFEIADQVEGDGREKTEHYHKQLQKLKDAKKHNIAIQELPKTAEVHEAIQLFDRVNSQGTDLGEAELALAHMSAQWADVRREMKKKQEEMSSKGFSFDLDFYVKSMVAAVTGTMTYEKVYDTSKEELVGTWKTLQETLDFATRFLTHEAHIPNSNYISSRAVMIPFIKYVYDNNAELSRKEKNSFQKWIYAALMWSRYSTSTDSKLTNDLSLLQQGENPTDELIDEIKDDRGRIKLEASDLEGRGGRSRRFYNMIRIITRANNPIDWKTGEPLNGTFELHSHHIFPKSQLYGKKYDSNNHIHRKRVNEIANRAFLTQKGNLGISNKLPKEYLPEVHKKHPEALARQFVPDNPELWKIENYEEFLQKRREILAENVNNFLEKLEEKGEDAGKDIKIRDLIRKGENFRIEFKETFVYDTHQNKPNKKLKDVAVKELCAFANSEGGDLVIGVDDDKNIKGIERDLNTMPKGKDDFELRLNQRISDKLGDTFGSIYTHVKFERIEGKTLCIVSVEPSPNPVFFGDNNEFIIRQGSSSKPLDTGEATEYIGEHFN